MREILLFFLKRKHPKQLATAGAQLVRLERCALQNARGRAGDAAQNHDALRRWAAFFSKVWGRSLWILFIKEFPGK